MKVTSLNLEHRGFELGYTADFHGYIARWKQPQDEEWIYGHIYVNSTEDAGRLARGCIDYNFKVLAKEIMLGRELAMTELPK